MSILEDLKRQAREQTRPNLNSRQVDAESDSSVPNDTALRQERNWKHLSPKMHLIYNFLREFAYNLNIVQPDVRINYNITKSIVIKNMHMQDFELVKPAESMKDFVFRYHLILNHRIKITINSESGSEKFRELLKKRQIKFTNDVLGPKKILFILEPKFITSFCFTADLDNCMIKLRMENFDGAWSTTMRYTVNKVNRELMEELGKYILGKDNKFMALSGNSVSDAVRAELRKKLRQEGKLTGSDSANKGQSSESLMDRTASRLKSLFGR